MVVHLSGPAIDCTFFVFAGGFICTLRDLIHTSRARVLSARMLARAACQCMHCAAGRRLLCCQAALSVYALW